MSLIRAGYQKLLRDLEDVEASDEDKAAFAEMVRKVAALNGVPLVDKSERIDYAAHLLHLREERTVIRDRLMTRFGIGRTTAYEVIDEALNCPEKWSKSGRCSG